MTASPLPDLDALLAHADWVHRLSLQLCRDEHAAADAAQETWLQALRHRPDARGSLRAFLGTVLQNVVRASSRGSGRRTRRERSLAPKDLAESAAEAAARAELHQWLGRAVLELPEPQRAFVLLHYFEGRPLADLASCQQLSVEAVRSHLRRARDTLRRRLHGDDGKPARVFATLLAAHPLSLPPFVLGAAMATSVKLIVVLAAALAIPTGYVAWQVANPAPPPLHVADGSPAGAVVATQATAEGPPSGARVDAAPLAARVRCQLTGVLPGVPWTTPIRVDLEHAAGTTTVSLTPAADGSFAVALPDQASARALTCRGDDRHYAPLAHELTVDVVRAALAAGTACPIAVAPIAVCTGVVVDGDGAAIAAARVAAAEWVEGKSAGAVIETNTDAAGAFVLRFPRPAEVVVVAVAMQEMMRSFRLTGADGAIPDTGAPREDLLPAATAARLQFGQWADVGRLVLEAPAWVRGRIVDPAGRPIADETVHWTPLRQPIEFRAGGLELRGETWERLALATTASTDAEGRFRVPARAGTTGTLAFASAELRYEPFVASRRAIAPADVIIELAGATAVLRVVRGEQPVPGVAVAYQGYRGGRWPVTDGNGNVRLLREQALPQQVTLRAPGLPFVPVTLPLDTQPDQPIVVDLAQLRPAPIVFSVTSRVPVRQVVATFARDGVPVGDSVAMQRDAATGELCCEFVPGAYQVAIHPAGGDGNDSYLLPAEISIEVPADGARVPLPLRHGGRIRVLLRDERGADIAGTLRFLAPDAGGHEVFLEVTGGLVFDGAVPGNGPALTNALEPGTWEVIADLGVRGVHRRRVEVSPCDITEVAVVVP